MRNQRKSPSNYYICDIFANTSLQQTPFKEKKKIEMALYRSGTKVMELTCRTPGIIASIYI